MATYRPLRALVGEIDLFFFVIPMAKAKHPAIFINRIL
jgi:hypothetical protein